MPTHRDPDLDLLLVRFRLETGACVQGALNLRRWDIDPTRATVWLREKLDSIRVGREGCVRRATAGPLAVYVLYSAPYDNAGTHPLLR